MKKFNNPTSRQGWEENTIQYSKLWGSPFMRWLSNLEAEYIKKSFKNYISQSGKDIKQIKILDIGSGAGRIISIYLNTFSIKKVYSTDYANNMVSFIRNKYGNKVEVKNSDISNEVPDFGIKFDFISSIRVIKYTKDWHKAIKNISKIINDNGYFIFTLPNKISITYFSNDPWVKVDLSEIEKVLDENGFKIINTIGFIRLPNFLYDISFLYYPNILLEATLRKIFRKHIFSREMFILARKI